MVTIKSNPLDRVSVRAARVISDGMRATAGGRLLGARSITSVDLDKVVPQLATEVDRQDAVTDTVLPEVGDGDGTAVAATDFGAGEHGHGAEDVGTGAGNGVAHATTPAPAGGKAALLVNAVAGLDRLEDGVGEGNVVAVAVGPTIVNALGSNEDGGHIGGKVAQSVEAAIHDIVHRTVAPVVADHELVRSAGVVVVGGLDDVFPVLSIDGEGVQPATEAWGRPAASAVCGDIGG